MLRLLTTTTSSHARHPAARLAALALVCACAALAARPLPAQVAGRARQEPVVAIGARRFVLSPRDDGTIHEVDEAGDVVRSFGSMEVPQEETTDRELRQLPIQREMTNQGVLRCDPASMTLVLLHQYLPVVRAFSVDGRLLWRTVLRDYRRIRWKWSPGEGRRAGARIGSSVDRSHESGPLVGEVPFHRQSQIHSALRMCASVARMEGELLPRFLSSASGLSFVAASRMRWLAERL